MSDLSALATRLRRCWHTSRPAVDVMSDLSALATLWRIYPALTGVLGLLLWRAVSWVTSRWEAGLPFFGWAWLVGSALWAEWPLWVGVAIAGWSHVFYVAANRRARDVVTSIIGWEWIAGFPIIAVVFLTTWWFLSPVLADGFGLSQWEVFRFGLIIVAAIPPLVVFVIGMMFVALGLPDAFRGLCESDERLQP